MSTGAGGSSGGAPASTGGVASTGAAASTGSASTGAAAFMGWGDGWRSEIAKGSTDPEKELKQLERYESPDQIWKKARELEVKMSKGELRAPLHKDATAQEIAAWRKENGVPDAPEGYKVTMPVGRQVPKEDDGFLKAFMKSAHDSNYTQAQVDAAISSFYSEVDRQEVSITAAEKKAEQETEDLLRKEWQSDYRTNKAMAEALLARAPAGFRDRFMNGYLADHTPIKASPEAWKWLVQIEREINPAATVVPGAGGDLGKTIEAEIIEIKKHMVKHGQPPYYKGPEAEKMQARYRDLIAAQEKLKAKAG